MTESDARWGGRGAWWGRVGQATARQCLAGQGWVGKGICLVREFSMCLVGVG